MQPATIRILIVLAAILLAAFVAIVSLINALAGGSEISERLTIYALLPDEAVVVPGSRRRARMNRLRLRLNSLLSSLSSEELALQILSANWQITESEFLLIRFWVTVLGLILGWVIFRSPLSGIGLAVIMFLIPGFYLQRSITQRRMRFERQLVDVLVLLTNAVRAGYSLLQAVDVVVREMGSPASEEFRRVRQETGLGLPLSQALLNLNARMENDDLYLVVTAININSQVGGNLVTMLEAVTTTIRERVRLFSEVRVLTAQQRFNSYILTLLPFGIGAAMFILNPDYISELFKPNIYLCIPAGALFNMIVGNIVIRRIARIQV